MTAPEAAELEAVDAALAGRYVHPEHAELAELALLLRDDRPEPAPAWATQLDRRAQARFPARPRKKRDWTFFRERRAGDGARARDRVARRASPRTCRRAATTTRARQRRRGDRGRGCRRDQRGQPGGGGAGAATGGGALDLAAPEGAPQAAPKAGDPNSDSRATAVTSSARRRSRSRRRAAELDRVAGQIGDVAADVGGFVDRSSITSSEGGSLRLRVPTGQLDTAIRGDLATSGSVRDLSRNSVDITSNVVSARDRLTEARTERESLLRQLAQADTVNETESIRARLDIVAREIAAAEGSLRRVRNRANFANLRVELVPTGGVDEGAWTPGDAFDDGLRVLEVAAGVAVIAAAILLPLLAIWLLAWLAHRVVVRRRRERSLDLA